MTNSIELNSLNKTYRNRSSTSVKAVIDLSLSVTGGTVFGFLGPNGAGKTTTIKMICGLVTPDQGTVLVNGIDVTRQRRWAMSQIGVVLEGTRNVYWRLSAWENLMYFGRLKGRRSRQIKSLGQRLLQDLELWDRRHTPVRQFSRGMQQKVAIACAYISDPQVILLDEPTLGLDVKSARTVRGWIRRLVNEEGKTVVLTTHQLAMAEELCDQVAIIRQGQLVANEPVGKLLHLTRDNNFVIKYTGKMENRILVEFPQLREEHENDYLTLSGVFDKQDVLFRLLNNLRDSGASLHSVVKQERSLEDVFVHLTEGE